MLAARVFLDRDSHVSWRDAAESEVEDGRLRVPEEGRKSFPAQRGFTVHLERQDSFTLSAFSPREHFPHESIVRGAHS